MTICDEEFCLPYMRLPIFFILFTNSGIFYEDRKKDVIIIFSIFLTSRRKCLTNLISGEVLVLLASTFEVLVIIIVPGRVSLKIQCSFLFPLQTLECAEFFG